ncbi:Glycosyl transferase, group 1 family protein [Altererythrobacter epoxidivorans]|uniref:Glycosyl transferase, group 1 family protein n=1 Tax=Altererythrobacter epoxidivorans TaxID=361183 RepID=A0A0M3TAR7_9SPHN|nr:glycosyltransferase [Altererythrobacter epoxidivorans]ALE17246.1 Glycosyl transferase, group 1 family protein [Altererythrobacter epoxidivorans]
MSPSPDVLVWLPHSYAARGPAESCVRLLEGVADAGLAPRMHLVRTRKPIPTGIDVRAALSANFRHVPYRLVARRGLERLKQQYAAAIDEARPGTVTWFWPGVPIDLVERAKRRGLVTVREMINSPLAHAKPLLDAAYAGVGLVPSHGITGAMVEAENAELKLYDYIFSSNAEVDAALWELGIRAERILQTSFGWSAARIGGGSQITRKPVGFRAVFLGSVGVRKGVPELLEAWKQANIDGQLVLAGPIEKAIRPLIAPYRTDSSIQFAGPVSDVSRLLQTADLFVFPTREEGGPQVTCEAAAFGLPILTTPMGAGRLVEDGRNGVIIEPGEVDALAGAIRRLASDAGLRKRLGDAARDASAGFEYGAIGRERAELLQGLVRK